MRENSSERTLLVTGSLGQIGSELVPALGKVFGFDHVLASDIKKADSGSLDERSSFAYLDVTDRQAIEKIVKEYDVGTVFHLAGILSATGELNIERTLSVNLLGLRNVLEVARESDVAKVFWPSSIAVFGSGAPKTSTPQNSSLLPETVYGVSKASGEMLCNYYFQKFGLDVRSLRLPGIISSGERPSGGTTDYAVEIFYEAISAKRYTCFVKEDTVLPMLYMPDCIEAIQRIIDADGSKIKLHSSYNLGGMSFSARELADEIKKYIPELIVEYKPDSRMQIADTWPRSIDDSEARTDWGWHPTYDLASMVKDMIEKISKKMGYQA